MARYRHRLPQLDDGVFLTDGGMETTFVFHDDLDLPHFAAFDLIGCDFGRQHMRDYYTRYAKIALQAGAGFILESPTWRANPDWGAKLGYSPQALRKANQACIDLLASLRETLETAASPMPISGCVGPRGDGYIPGELMEAQDAQSYHAAQIEIFRDSAADFVSAFTMNNAPEAIGITRAAEAAGIPAVISFTVETDGRLPTGQTLAEAIDAVDGACAFPPVHYMINCAHPSHFASALEAGGAWVERIRGLRANASRCSHAELEQASELDSGDPIELAGEYRGLLARHRHINVLGGCCGSDHRHIAAIAEACLERGERFANGGAGHFTSAGAGAPLHTQRSR